MPLDHATTCAALTTEIGRFADLVRGSDLSTTVPSCPGWTLAKLIRHQGEVHRWAAKMVTERVTERLDRRTIDMVYPDAPEDLADWLAAGAPLLTAAFDTTPPDTPMWTFGGDKHATFWARRQLHETAVHRADAALALNVDPAIEPAVAIDGIDENLDLLPNAVYFAPNVANLKGNGETIHFHATDGDGDDAGEWMITLHPDGFSYTHGHGKGDVAARGTASDLLMLVTRRYLPSDGRYQVFGNESLLKQWLDNVAL